MTKANKGVDAGIGRLAALAEADLWWEAIFLNGLKISFKSFADPVVSIVIVSFNGSRLLARTLANLSHHDGGPGAPFEAIIVDNASGPDNHKLLARVEGATIIANDTNTGFGPACNLGAARARGRYLLFLNPDIDLLPGALSAMVDGFNLFESVGIVGARLVFPGGRLQEAGASFVDDAQVTHPYLRGSDDASAPEAVFARETGYVSGAALMIERQLFKQLRGFDDAFAPAYFEDTDLCLRVARSGRRIVYQPRAVGIHYENGTSSSREDVERMLDAHRAKFLALHGKWLFGSGVHPTGFMQREPNRYRFRVLYIDDRTPHLDSGSGLPRANSIVNAMAKMGYLVTILPIYVSDPDVAARYRDLHPTIEILDADTNLAPRRVIRDREGYYDAIWVSRPHNVALIAKTFLEMGVAIRKWTRGRVIFDTEAIFATRAAIADFAAGAPLDGATLERAVASEVALGRMADAVVCVSRAEERMLRRFGGLKNVRVLGHCLSPKAHAAPFEKRNGVVFVGLLLYEDSPNVDSIAWFLERVWPRLAKRLGSRAHFTLVGDIAPQLRQKFERSNVTVLGRVDDLDEVFDKARVAVAPTRFAAGIPHKVHNSVAHGLPTVISSLLRSQLGWDDGEGCLSASVQHPETFADVVLRLHNDRQTWEDVRRRGLQRIAAECDERSFSASIRDICEERIFV